MTKQPIILCGYTSCGKTTIGRLLAKKLKVDFYDTDQMLTEQNQMTIPEIFDRGGEALFRRLECEIVNQVCRLGPSVVSTGGGMLASEDNSRLLSEYGIIVYLQRPFQLCYQSMAARPDRPLFRNHTKEELASSYEIRADLYKKYASFMIKNEGSPEEAVERICDSLQFGNDH